MRIRGALAALVMGACGCSSAIPPGFPNSIPVAISPYQFCNRDAVAEAPLFERDGDWWFVRLGVGDAATYMHIRRAEVDLIRARCGAWERRREELRLGWPRAR